MTTRIIVIGLDTPVGNKMYWFLKEIMVKYPTAIKELKERKTNRMTEEKALAELMKVREYYGMNRKGYNDVIAWLEGKIKRRSK